MDDQKKAAAGFIYSAVTDKHTNYRLKGGPIAVLILAAAICDLITLIPIAGDIVGPLYWIFVGIYLYKKGFGIMNVGRLATELISMAGEMVPGIQEFPLLLAGTALVIILTRVEDKTGVTLRLPGRTMAPGSPTIPPPLNEGGVRLPSSPQEPLNRDGIRRPLQPMSQKEETEDMFRHRGYTAEEAAQAVLSPSEQNDPRKMQRTQDLINSKELRPRPPQSDLRE